MEALKAAANTAIGAPMNTPSKKATAATTVPAIPVLAAFPTPDVDESISKTSACARDR
jgi:hypothetical protein